MPDRLKPFRLRQPLQELERKAIKARRPGFWTQEELDYAEAQADVLYQWMNDEPSTS